MWLPLPLDLGGAVLVDRILNKVILGEYFETERPCLLYFWVEVAVDFKARAMLVLKLRMANLLKGATSVSTLK